MRIPFVDGEPQPSETVMEVGSSLSPDLLHRNYDMIGDGEEYVFINVQGEVNVDLDEIQLLTGLKTLLEELDPANN